MTQSESKHTVLAVDDTPENLDVVKGILVPEYTVKVAVNGKMALKIAQAQPPDLILLDIMMPEMDGYEVCRQLKSNPQTRNIPVIFLTAKDQTQDEAKGFELGAADYILKPVSPPILEARVKTHLTLKQHMDDLQKAYGIIKTQKERMQEELDVGRNIQMSLVPQKFPAFPDREEFDVYATLQPAREVGGDLYDFYLLDKDRLCFCIGDVSGKGVPAALFMAMTKTLIKSRAADDCSTASIITHVNEELSRDNPSSMFVTVFAAILNIGTGELTYTNAGHNPPYLIRKQGSSESLAERHGPIVAAMPDMIYVEDTIQLKRGDILTLSTDGVTEAMDESNNLFSDDRLERLLREGDLPGAEETVEAIMAGVGDFVGEAEQSDDITILSLQYLGSGDEVHMHRITIEIDNDVSEIPKVDEEFDRFAEQAGLAPAIVQTLHLIFEELLDNIIKHGYRDDERHSIEVKIELSGGRLSVTITDDGIPFNPLKQVTPDTSLSIDDREIGGLGVHLVKSMTDECRYQRKIDKNVLSLMKRIDK